MGIPLKSLEKLQFSENFREKWSLLIRLNSFLYNKQNFGKILYTYQKIEINEWKSSWYDLKEKLWKIINIVSKMVCVVITKHLKVLT